MTVVAVEGVFLLFFCYVVYAPILCFVGWNRDRGSLVLLRMVTFVLRSAVVWTPCHQPYNPYNLISFHFQFLCRLWDAFTVLALAMFKVYSKVMRWTVYRMSNRSVKCESIPTSCLAYLLEFSLADFQIIDVNMFTHNYFIATDSHIFEIIAKSQASFRLRL